MRYLFLRDRRYAQDNGYKQQGNAEVKFILATGYSLADQDKGILKKMSAIEQKPYTTNRVARLIRDILGK